MTVRRTIRLASHALAAALALLVHAGPCSAQQPTYNVGSTPTGIPFTFLDVKTNTIQGAMVDLITAIGDDAGFKVNIQATPFSALIPSLTSNKIDIIAAAMLINAQRKEVIAFSEPVFPYPEGMVVSVDDNTPYKSLADLKGQVVDGQGRVVPLGQPMSFDHAGSGSGGTTGVSSVSGSSEACSALACLSRVS